MAIYIRYLATLYVMVLISMVFCLIINANIFVSFQNSVDNMGHRTGLRTNQFVRGMLDRLSNTLIESLNAHQTEERTLREVWDCFVENIIVSNLEANLPEDYLDIMADSNHIFIEQEQQSNILLYADDTVVFHPVEGDEEGATGGQTPPTASVNMLRTLPDGIEFELEVLPQFVPQVYDFGYSDFDSTSTSSGISVDEHDDDVPDLI